MEFLDRQQAIDCMNRLVTDDKEFLFIIDYKANHAIISPYDKIAPEECLYAIGTISNCPNKKVPHSTTDIEWEAFPPSQIEYNRCFDVVSQNLHDGNSYLANLTCRIPVRSNLSLKDIFLQAEAPYKLWLKDKFVCFSPETFIRISDNRISSFPMKGTIDAECPDAERQLIENPKEAAEHATIVDLIRNDLSLVADNVHVSRYRYIDRLHTNHGDILQSSSEITGTLPHDWKRRFGEIIYSQLPAGSITGAPKPKTCEIIARAEGYERGFYTGIFGYYANGRVDSAVMIRFIDLENGLTYFKAGGGITAQSDRHSEYLELLQKIYLPIAHNHSPLH